MISLKKSLDSLEQLERQARTAVGCYRSAIGSIAAHLVPVDNDLVHSHRSRLVGLRREVGENPTVEHLEATREALDAELKKHCEQAAAILEQKVKEVKEILRIVGEMVATLTAQNKSHGARLGEFANQLSSLSRLDSLPEIRARLADGVRQLKTCIAAIEDERRTTLGQLQSELQTFEQRLQQAETLAFTDALTGVGNRAAGQRTLDHWTQSDKPFSVLMFDLDRFKAINDRWGHQAGDMVLKTFARRLGDNVRPGDLVCRWGGDEFLVLLACCRMEEALGIARRLSACCKQPYQLSANGRNWELEVHASVGAAEYRYGEAAEELIARADKFLYREKQVPVIS